MERRHFLKHLAAISATSLFSVHLPRICAWAQQGQARPHFFMFVFARGGWDPTMVFEPTKLGLTTIDLDPSGELLTLPNGITFLDSPNRPMVRTFFEDFGDRSCIINGVDTTSTSHSGGTEIMMTGSSGMNRPDWPTIMVSQQELGEFMIPYMALSGPSFSGSLGSGTASGSGFLDLLVGGGVSNTPSATDEMNMDEFVSRRFTRHMDRLMAQGRGGLRNQEMEEALGKWTELKSVKTELGAEFNNLNGLANEGRALAAAFERGYAMTGSLQARGSWDSHNNNFQAQNQGFQNTFNDLHSIVTNLAARPATAGAGTLLDQTTILLMSEMGRTPKLNGSNGKDHWSTTSVLAIGGSVKGGQVLGGTDDYQNAVAANYTTGLVDPSGQDIQAANLGAALLQLAGVNSASFLAADIRPFNAFLV